MAPLYRLFLGNLATRGRLIGLLSLGAVAVLIGFALGQADLSDPLDDSIDMIRGVGLSLIVPVVTLVLASASLGDPNEDGTLVYLWHRPTPRWQLAVAAFAASLTVALPIVVIPMTIAAALTGVGGDLVVGTIASCALAVVAYAGLFTWLGLRVKRAMAWGLAYILLWEGFISNAGEGAEAFSIRSYTGAVLSRIAGAPADLAEATMANGVVVPLGAAVGATLLTVRRLHRQDVA